MVQELLKSDKPAAKKRQTIIEFDKVLGLGLNQYKEPRALPAEVKRLMAERQRARLNKDFNQADELRRQLEERGIKINDLPNNEYEIE